MISVDRYERVGETLYLYGYGSNRSRDVDQLIKVFLAFIGDGAHTHTVDTLVSFVLSSVVGISAKVDHICMGHIP